MCAHKLRLYAVLLYGSQWDFTSGGIRGVAIHNVQVVSDIEGASIEAHMTVGAQAQDIAVDIRASFRTAQSMYVSTFRVALAITSDRDRDTTYLASVVVQPLHSPRHCCVSNDAVDSGGTPAGGYIELVPTGLRPRNWLVQQVSELLLN